MHRIILSLLVIFLLMVAVGCSSNGTDPITPAGNETEFSVPLVDVNPSDSNRSMLGSWIAVFNPETLAVEITPDRSNAGHINVTSFIPAPGIVVNSYNPATKIIDVDVTIHNTSAFYGYDVRLIIYTDTVGHKLLNADSWTGLYDKPDGLPINPFKAYAKTEPGREFLSTFQHTENFLIRCPGDNFAVSFAVDASYPNNCAEPYEIKNFFHGILEQTTGSSTNANVTVRDWQGDTNSVYLNCPAITGIDLEPLSQSIPTLWEMVLVNNTGAPAGDYVGFVLATSTGSGTLALYNEVVITVTKVAAIDPVGNVTLQVNRTGVTKKIDPYVPWTLTWDSVPGAQEYAIYYDNEPTNPYYFMLIDTVPGAQTTFNVPTIHFPPNHLVRGNTYIVRARATAGDPSSESIDSEYAYVAISCFDTLGFRYALHNNQTNREGWTSAVQRDPYAESDNITYWPYTTTLYNTSEPYALSLIPMTLGLNWTTGTGNASDDYPGKLMAITRETPPIADSSVRRIDFCATTAGSWITADLGGVVFGTSDALTQPMAGWDGSDFIWTNPEGAAQGHQSYIYRHTSVTYPLPFNMDNYVPPNYNCWRWCTG